MSAPELNKQIGKAIIALKSGQLIAYPTEAVFGLGCDPFNQDAVQTVRKLKNRNASKGFILIASNWDQIKHLAASIPENAVGDNWPGPVTKIFPASDQTPKWICANNHTIALRITDHPVAALLCQVFGGPIVSTSANPEGSTPAKTAEQVREYFEDQINVIVDAPVGDLDAPTTIIDASSGEVFRKN